MQRVKANHAIVECDCLVWRDTASQPRRAHTVLSLVTVASHSAALHPPKTKEGYVGIICVLRSTLIPNTQEETHTQSGYMERDTESLSSVSGVM
jgi:hypothetical protein